MNLVQQAINYAGNRNHEGAAYTLEVLGPDGLAEYRVEMLGAICLLVDEDNDRPTFIDWDAVRSVAVVWK